MIARRRGLDRWLHRFQRAAQLTAVWLVVALPSVVWADDRSGFKPTTPDGLGNLLNPPPGLVPEAGKSLFEYVGMEHYILWSDLGVGDVIEKSAIIIYAPVQLISMLLVRLGIGMSWWLDRLTAQNTIAGSIGGLIESSANLFNVWLLPTALAVGAFIAYAMARRGQSALSQIATVAVIGVFAVGLGSSGTKIVSGLDQGRSLLSNSVGQATGDAMITADAPLRWPTDFNQGTPQQQLARKSGDTIWRTFAVTMWCESQFGSMKACEQYGPEWLKLDSDEKRKNYTDDVVSVAEGGGDAATVRHMQGHQPAMRITIAIFSFILGAAAGLIIAGLSMVALMSWIIALLLLALAAFFACLMVIPGRPRRWGLDYFNTIIAATIGSALIGGLLWGTLAATGAIAAVIAPLGFLPMAALALAVLLAGWKSKSLLEGVLYSGTSMRGQGDTGMRLGAFLGARGAIKGGKRATRALAGAAGGIGGAAARTVGKVAGMATGVPKSGAGSSHGAYKGAASYVAGVSNRRTAGASRIASLRPGGRTDGTGPGSTDTGSDTGPGRRDRSQDNGRYRPNTARRNARDVARRNAQQRAQYIPSRGEEMPNTYSWSVPSGKTTDDWGRSKDAKQWSRPSTSGKTTAGHRGRGTPAGQDGGTRRPNPNTDSTGGAGRTPSTTRRAGQPGSRFVELKPTPRTPDDGRPPRRQPPPPTRRKPDGDPT